jgi:hypothetical protein
MLQVGRTAAEQKAFEAQLLTTHRIRVQVKLLALGDGKEVADLSARLLDGQVNIDASGETTRSADLTLNDPDRVLHLDSRGLGDGGVFLDRMVSISYGVLVESLGRWIDVPVFKGPVTGLARDGSSLALTCLGKEHLSKGNAWSPMSFKKGHDVVATIRAILRERGGETSFAFPARGGRLPDALALGRMTQPWATAASLARSINRQLYYDGAGTCRLRIIPAGTVWTFKSGDGGSVLTEPNVTYDLGSISNLVWVKGKKAKKKPQISNTAVAPRAHALSPWSLGRNNVPRYLVTEVDNDKIRTKAAAGTLARTQLATLLREGVQVEFDALPVPHLDPLDPVALNTPDASLTFTLMQASLPLVHSGVMSVGTNRRVTPNKAKVR